MPVNDIYQGNIEFVFQDNPNNLAFYLRVRAVSDEDGITTDITTFLNARVAALRPHIAGSVVFKCTNVRQLFPTKSLPKVEELTATGDRMCTGGPLPGQCSMVATLYGDKTDPTRHNRGRDFLTGFCCEDQTGGVFDSGIASITQDICDMYQAMTNEYVAPSGNEFDIGVFSLTQAKKTLATPPPVPLPEYFWPLQLVRVKTFVRTQRRRQPIGPCEVVCDAPIS